MAPSLIAPIDDLAPEPRRESMSEGGRTLSLVEQAVERLRSESLRDDYPTLDVIDDSPIEPQNLVRRDFTNEGDPAHDVDKRTSEEIGPFIDPQISATFGEATRLSSTGSVKAAQSVAGNRNVEHAGEPHRLQRIVPDQDSVVGRVADPIAPDHDRIAAVDAHDHDGALRPVIIDAVQMNVFMHVVVLEK